MTQELCDAMNERVGNLTEIQCDVCKNKGVIYIVRDDEILSKTCDCMKERKIIRTLKSSGLYDSFQTLTFDLYKTTEQWQKNAKQKALEFIDDELWFVIVGVVGSGKTHLCTAISQALIKKGYDFKYLSYVGELPSLSKRLKSGFPDVRENAEREFERIKTVKVLYIDDYLKNGESDLTYEIINERYLHKDLITIISSEMTWEQQLRTNEALASRIYERANKYWLNISKDQSKNYRLAK